MKTALTYAIAAGAIAAGNAHTQQAEPPPHALVEQSIQKEERPYYIKVQYGWKYMTESEFKLYQQEQEESRKALEEKCKPHKQILNGIQVSVLVLLVVVGTWYYWTHLR